jgi:phosphatidylglycerophosphate synthase
MIETTTGPNRRFLKTRQRAWAGALARRLAAMGVRPNAVSLAGVLFAAAAGASFMAAPAANHSWRAWFAGAVFVQLRLLCNMLDGMLAIEGGMKSKLGDLYNDLPDRISDSLILVGAGYSVEWLVPGGSALGWCAALFAALTAYVRLLGGSLGVPQYFSGPLAKQHRMFVITLGALISAVQSWSFSPGWVMAPTLVIVVLGSAATIVRRTTYIVRDLQQR